MLHTTSSVALGSAPACNKLLIISRFPLSAAIWRGVAPPALIFTFAPACRLNAKDAKMSKFYKKWTYSNPCWFKIKHKAKKLSNKYTKLKYILHHQTNMDFFQIRNTQRIFKRKKEELGREDNQLSYLLLSLTQQLQLFTLNKK